MFTSLVVVDDLDIVHTIVTPDETQPPLIVAKTHADRRGGASGLQSDCLRGCIWR
jgi:hypothetical protein